MEILENTNVDDQQVENQQVEQPDTGTPQNDGQDDSPEFGLDKDGNFVWNTDEYDNKYPEEDSEEDSNQQQEEPADGNEQQEQPTQENDDNSNTETQDEEPKFKVKVDGEEIEVTQEELLRGYMRQKDYTQKTKQLAEQRKQFEQYRPQQQFQPQQQQQSTDLNAMAKEIAAKSLGLESVDDLSELDFNHITAVVEAKQALLNQRNQMMYRQQNISNLEEQLRSEEPKYDEIMSRLGDAIQNLPVNKYNKLQRAYNEGNPEPLREFFKEMQKDYYAQSIQKVEQKKKPVVPKVEHTANTPVTPTRKGVRVDYNKFGHMTTDQKAKVLLEMGLLD